MEQQVAELAGVQSFQTFLILRIELGTTADGESFGLAGVDLPRGPAAVLPAIDEPGELARGPALLVEVRRLNQLLQDAQLVIGVENGEVGLESDKLGVGP